MDRPHAWELLTNSEVAVLGTTRPDGRAHLVPFVFAVVGRQLVTAVDDKPKSTRELARITNIEHDSRVEVLAHGYDSDWARLWWVRASGTATIHRVRPSQSQALEARFPQYQKLPPQGPWILIEVSRLVGWAANS